MPRRYLRYTLSVALLGAAFAEFLTGLLSDRLDLRQFAVHRWAGYDLAGLVAVHVAAHWRFFLAPFAPRRQAAILAVSGRHSGGGSCFDERPFLSHIHRFRTFPALSPPCGSGFPPGPGQRSGPPVPGAPCRPGSPRPASRLFQRQDGHPA